MAPMALLVWPPKSAWFYKDTHKMGSPTHVMLSLTNELLFLKLGAPHARNELEWDPHFVFPLGQLRSHPLPFAVRTSLLPPGP